MLVVPLSRGEISHSHWHINCYCYYVSLGIASLSCVDDNCLARCPGPVGHTIILLTLLGCNLSLGYKGYIVEVPIGVEQSMVTDSLYFDHLWNCVIAGLI